MRLFLISFLSLISMYSFGQEISGQVVDADNSAVEFASVRLFKASDSSVVSGIYTNVDGEYTLQAKDLGEHYILITFSGLETASIPISIENRKSIALGAIVMEVDATINLEEVNASGSLDVLKAGIDKKVYSVADDISVKGGTVNDVLNNIPSIDVDQDGNISLRGDGNVTILIDGRPSTLASGDGQNMLDALPANSIERIEVVTNPSAKYDPDGTSGIINIVLKKNKLKGFNGLIAATAATGNLYEANLGLSYRNKNFNLYLNYSFNYYEGYRNFYSDLERDLNADSVSLLNQSREGEDLKMTNTLVIGSDFYFNERNLFAVALTGSLGSRERTGNLENRSYINDVLVERWDRNSRDPRSHLNADVNLNYTHTFKEQKGEWSFNANQSFGEQAIEGFYEEQYFDEFGSQSGLAPLNQQLSNASTNRVTTVQTDFSHIFKDVRARLEIGGKVIAREDFIDTFSETRDTISGDFFEDTLANYDYSYSENIYSVYATFGQELGKFKYQAGIRGEYAEQTPFLITSDEKYANTYLNIFPSAHVKYDFTKSSQISLSYSRRINRASSRQLNPFTSYADPTNLMRGNPQLQPEYIDSYDLGYSLNKKKFNFSVSVYHRRTKDVINRVKLYNANNSSVLTYGNIDQSESTGLETVIIYKPFNWMKNTVSFNGNYINYTNSTDDGSDWNNDGLIWGVKYILGIDFWKKTASIQLNFNYSAPRTTPQGIIQRGTIMGLAIEKRFLDKRLTIGARVTDIFNTMQFTGELEQVGLKQNVRYKWLTRRFYLTVSYRIGNYDKRKTPGSSSGSGF
ncbi:MAG: TonB-dependent receptor [Crocinitomicaceae bacterium]|nr:TonB-dependent receptor [Crocinitomicaceae bacterium]